MVSRWEKTPSLSLEDIVGICCITGEWTSKGRELTPKTTYYACAVGVNAQAQINTDVTVVEIVTPEETSIDYAFDFAVSDHYCQRCDSDGDASRCAGFLLLERDDRG